MLLNPVISKLAGKRVVLASASPRRQDILSNVGLRFEVVPSWFKETLDKSLFSAPYEYAVETAKQKALEVASRMHVKHLKTPDIVIGADTIVTLEDAILEKPFDKQDAYNMLSRLSGKEHSVFTGVAIVHCRSQEDNHLETDIIDFYEETKVKFADLSEDLLWEYIDSGEPMDKAGGYGIQSLGGMLVESVHGDFLNVVGFPLNHFCKKLAEIYYPPPKQSIHREKHDSIPYVESFENLSDVEKDCPSPSKTCEAKKGYQDRVFKAAGSSGSSLPYTPGLQNGVEESPKHCAQKLSKISDLIDGFKASKTLFAASKLKVFDKLKDKGALKAMEIADKINASVHGTERLLDACVALGLLEKTHQVYSNTELANTYLVSDAAYSIHEYIMYANDHLWFHFTHLDSAVVEGRGQHQTAIKKTCDGVHGPEVKKRRMRAMHCTLKITARDIVTAFDLSKYSFACDLGGGTGVLAHELVWTYPEMKVEVFDLPEVINLTSQFQPEGFDSSHVTLTSGNFMEDILPKADLYILSRVLHDLPEGPLNHLLKKVSEACHPGRSALLIAEIVLDEDKKEPRGLLQSLSMSEGKQRSGTEYKKLLENNGFNSVQIKNTGNLLDAILAVKR
ncbi:probable bifunctional dTTP/UTP pyrophosphatase/methyltransferase protein [Hyla sarda]|uniref:probable bifunctional dTTP/UTP pyrophosphatase/methyltransferase protein n=1 Tax=Hyla sarda TaxID=327740 RepID=UPI0024C3DD10|nr:probable bifunctional dTTP/UTP pyrophosphatase/methyltransferase protein [Hyla sarda]XP_056414769.1 probable bifunctional dTTP/UTP pyrophosphatase/methyltransferase protein [Hyla sarda]XP_056414770.1 probable bifunctional dTTP/UTP pyrophosphatase/methyltransferase protein [Hyla sarda]